MSRLAFLLVALAAPQAIAADAIQTDIKSTGSNSHSIRFTVHTPAAQSAVWTVLRDFDHHPEYVPYLTKSAVVSRGLEHDVVDQEGKVRILLWTFTLQVKQKVEAKPMSSLTFEAIGGDFKELRGAWNLEPAGEGTQIECTFSIEPRRRVPGWAVRFATKRYLGAMVAALIRRAETEPPPLPAPGVDSSHDR